VRFTGPELICGWVVKIIQPAATPAALSSFINVLDRKATITSLTAR
jgi:hypothetical protein